MIKTYVNEYYRKINTFYKLNTFNMSFYKLQKKVKSYFLNYAKMTDCFLCMFVKRTNLLPNRVVIFQSIQYNSSKLYQIFFQLTVLKTNLK